MLMSDCKFYNDHVPCLAGIINCNHACSFYEKEGKEKEEEDYEHRETAGW